MAFSSGTFLYSTKLYPLDCILARPASVKTVATSLDVRHLVEPRIDTLVSIVDRHGNKSDIQQ